MNKKNKKFLFAEVVCSIATLLLANFVTNGCAGDMPAGVAVAIDCDATANVYQSKLGEPKFQVFKTGKFPKKHQFKFFGHYKPMSLLPPSEKELYYDGGYTVDGYIPDPLKGSYLVQVDEHDRTDQQHSGYLQLALSQDKVTNIWIAFDSRAVNVPTWLTDDLQFKRVSNLSVQSTDQYYDPASKNPNKTEPVIYNMYAPKDLNIVKSNINLGGNNGPGVEWKRQIVGAQYLVIVKMDLTIDRSIVKRKLADLELTFDKKRIAAVTDEDLEIASKQELAKWLANPNNNKRYSADEQEFIGAAWDRTKCEVRCYHGTCSSVGNLSTPPGLVHGFARSSEAEIDFVKSYAQVELIEGGSIKGSAKTSLRGQLKFQVNRDSNVVLNAMDLFGLETRVNSRLKISKIAVSARSENTALCDDGLPPGPFRLCGKYKFPAGTNPGFKATVTSKVNKKDFGLVVSNTSPVKLNIDFNKMSIHMGGMLTNTFNVDGDIYTLRITVNLEGYFTSLAPVASLGETKPEWECADAGVTKVTLDGSSSFDELHPGSITSYHWVQDAGRSSESTLGYGKQITVPMAFGLHEVSLLVTDHDGLTSSEAIDLRVMDSQIDHMTVPNDIWEIAKSNGNQMALGTASGSDKCSGQVRITNNAPASGNFGPGLTLVRWRFDDFRGNVEFHDQKVFVLEPAYFPAPHSLAAVAKPHLQVGDVQELAHETFPQGVPMNVDEYVVIRTPSGEAVSFDELGMMVPGSFVPHAVNAAYNTAGTWSMVFSGVFSNYFTEQGLYKFETYLVRPGGSPEHAEDIIAYDKGEFFFGDPK